MINLYKSVSLWTRRTSYRPIALGLLKSSVQKTALFFEHCIQTCGPRAKKSQPQPHFLQNVNFIIYWIITTTKIRKNARPFEFLFNIKLSIDYIYFFQYIGLINRFDFTLKTKTQILFYLHFIGFKFYMLAN